ncbi:hypothetical protein LDO26_03940 [Luteimonas sp. BDR2-5]|uniref:hypothetical protein n=1 Tax=Proluteimonas luteida TaxID=2878685 RepID=UPI001E630F51|nr:hypothetical protein [Luteimonas sp. BDR2-5]MCD9027366.1 hypothetical protein [Luteimonas sp. BDR2-5]
MPRRILSPLRAHRRGLRRAAWAVLALYLLYLIAANVFLNSAIGVSTINRKPERYHAQWDWAASLYPGQIHARGVVMGGHARTTRWTAATPVAQGRIKLLPLLWKEVRFGTIRARDVSLHVARAATDLPSTKRPGKSPWTLRFDAITTPSLLRMDFYDARVTGTGAARFGFVKTMAGGPMEVLPSTLEMPDATLSVGGFELVRDAALEFGIAIPAHLRQQAQGDDKLVLLDATLRVDGRAPGIDLQARGDQPLPIAAGDDAGHVRADLAMHRGVLVPGSRLDWSAPVSGLDAQGQPVRHPLGVALRVQPAGIAIAARVPRQGDNPTRLHADLRIGDRRLLDPDDWLRPVRALSGTVDLGWRFASLRWLDRIIAPQDWLQFDGEADLEAALRLADGSVAEGSTFRVSDAQLRVDILDNSFRGSAHASGRVARDGEAGLRTTIDVVSERFSLTPGDAPDTVYLRGRDLRLDLASSGDLARFHEQLQARLRFDGAEIPDLRAYNRYLPPRSARLLAGSGAASGDLTLDQHGQVLQGRLQLQGRQARIALGPSRLSGDLRVDSRIAQLRTGGRRYAFEGFDLRVDNVRVEDADDAPWWARFRLDAGTLDWREPFALEGEGHLDMKDVSVLLALFAERSVFPRWIANLVDSGEASATGRLRVRDDEIVFDRIVASNDRIDLLARLRIAGGTPQGDLYARWGVLGLGVELEDGDRKLHVAGARKWYDARPPLLPGEG